ncbi:MAG: glycine cleavage system protein GcvH [Anaerolineales bacterium]|nr:MAG: glycine cleavage system protein GcvH [Anaerolineales bacterium]
MNLDPNARYAETHEWARKEDGLIVCGITDHAQEELSDVVYVEFPQVGDTLAKDEVFGVIESVKAASDLYMPMGGEIVEVNVILEDSPEIVNEDPYGKGWMIKFNPSDPSEWDDLLMPEAYEASVAGE